MKSLLSMYKESEYLEVLPTNIIALINELESTGLPLDVIADNISSNPSTGIVAKGSEKWDKSLFRKVLSEVATLASKDESELAHKLKKEGNITVQAIIAYISGIVGEKIGAGPAICVPFVVFSVIILLRAGFNVITKADDNIK